MGDKSFRSEDAPQAPQGNPALRQNLNKQNIGSVMSQLGFKKIHKEKGNGWAVIEKEPQELNNDAAVSPNDKLED